MADVKYEDASRIYAGDPPVRAVDSLNLDIPDGEFLVLVGPSGSGKSTALRMLAGLEDINEGRIIIGGRDVTNVPPKNRDIAMVFQSYALYPHMTVAENLGFSLKLHKVPKEERVRRVQEVAQVLGVEELLDR
jgi:multiple sugar transport system ATP-binding protein